MEQRIIDVTDSYQNDYFPDPGLKKSTTNSNSFTFGMLREGLFGGLDEY
jgi:hypothetical protein